MKKAAVVKAREKLFSAKAHYHRLGQSRGYEEFCSIWSDFLVKANSIHSILEFGARHHPKSEPWFGGKMRERRKDPLLSYMHHARNTDEHGLDSPVKYQPLTMLSVTEGDESFKFTEVREGLWKLEGVNGRQPDITMSLPRAILIPVTDDRYGDTFNPPESHLGQPMADNSPEVCGQLWLEYLDRLVREAAERVS